MIRIASTAALIRTPAPTVAPTVAVAALALALSLAGCKKEPAQPEPVVTEAPSEDATQPAQASVEDWIRANYRDAVTSDLGKLQYATAQADLDGDGTPEVLAYLGGPMFCGTGGCNLVVLKWEGEGFRKMGETSVVQLPVGVLSTKSHGWQDIAVTVSGGGITAGVARLRFNGTTYPDNASAEVSSEATSVGRKLIAQDALKPLD